MSPTVKKYLLGLTALFVTYALCVFYNALILLGVLVSYATKRHTRFWERKPHSKPASLSDSRYGEHKFITVNGVKLHCVINGPADKPLMLFVHGFPEFWYSWRHQIEEFAGDYRTVAFDMRGYGDSDKPAGLRPYLLPTLVEDVRALIAALGYTRCTLVCHDWGAIVGWAFVQQHMPLVDRYVMMGAPSSSVWRQSLMSSLDQFRKSWYVFWFQMPLVPEWVSSFNDLAMFKAIGTADEDLEAFKYTFAEPGALTAPINYYRANLQFLVSRHEAKVDKYAPGLFLLGEKDRYISQQTGVQQQKMSGNLRFETVPGANHFVQQHAPAATNALMRSFLREK